MRIELKCPCGCEVAFDDQGTTRTLNVNETPDQCGNTYWVEKMQMEWLLCHSDHMGPKSNRMEA
jgi:hypothetical protein